MSKECVNGCEFSYFSDGGFKCSYYNKNLEMRIHPINSKIIVHRCRECIEEDTIGSNTESENVRKIKRYIGWMADSFYSHKDDFESNLTEIYRILKKMEEEGGRNED